MFPHTPLPEAASTLYDPIESSSNHMQIKLLLAGRRSAGTVAVLLLLLLTGAVAVSSRSTTAALSLDDGNAASTATRRGSSWWQGRHGRAARRLLLVAQPDSTVGKDTNEFHVEGVRRPANGKLAGEVGFDAGWKHIPDRDSNRKHN